MRLHIRALVGVIAAAVVISASSAEDYDLVITNGRVMDPETMYDSIANVGISAGRIAVITQDKISGKQAIDATGHVVAPGFIDTHWHYAGPGQPIRFDPVKSRFEPITLDGWYKTYYAAPIDLGGGGVPGSQPVQMGDMDIHVH